MTNSDISELAKQIVDYENSPEVQSIKQDILRQVAMDGDVKTSRIPAPQNITEVGGYFNMLEKLNAQDMMRQAVTSALGLPAYNSSLSKPDQIKDKTIDYLMGVISNLQSEIEELKKSLKTATTQPTAGGA